MTKADLLILQDAAEEFSLESAENLGVNKSVCLQTAALAILCRVVSSLMAGEGEEPHGGIYGEAPPPLSSGELERGWNAALDAAIAEMRERGFMMDADPTVMMLRRLRKEPS